MMNKKTIFMGLCASMMVSLQGIMHTNLFNPYDILLTPPAHPESDECVELSVAYERTVRSHSYQAAEDKNGNAECFRRKSDCVLRLYQDDQDFLAALKGGNFTQVLSQLGQKFNFDDDNGTIGLYRPCGNLEVNNLMFSARYYLPHGFFVSFYLPLIATRLKDVCWQPAPNNTTTTFDSQVTNNLIGAIGDAANINLFGWERAGIGDISAIVWWVKDFPQRRPLLRNVGLGLRLGGVLPTGLKEDKNQLFAFPFGYDTGFGLVFGGTLDLQFFNCYHFGVDIELLYLFGRDGRRAIKTDPAQTDLLLFNRACVYVDPGFVQHFTLYGKADQLFCEGFAAQIAYQYTKQQETRYFLSQHNVNLITVNDAEYLQPWTVHNIIFGLEYDFYRPCECVDYRPYVQFMYKHGFNGSRTMAFDTITFQVAVDF